MKAMRASICLGILLLNLAGCLSVNTSSKSAPGEAEAKLVNLGNDICQDASSGLMWSMERSERLHEGEAARKYAEDLVFGGYNDWRLPTKKELYRLHDIIFRHQNGDCELKVSGSYWCEIEEKEALAGYWETYYLCSPEYRYIETPGTGMVRAVRP